MKRKLLSILALLCLTVSSAWAQEEQEQEQEKYLYLVLDVADPEEEANSNNDIEEEEDVILSATLMYGSVPEGKYYYDGEDQWLWKPAKNVEEPEQEQESGLYEDILDLTDLTVDESCQEFEGESLFNLFKGWISLSTITDIENLNTANVTDMSGMFNGCLSLTELDLSDWDTSNVETMESMFNDCDNLTSLNLSSWNTSNVTDMNSMFMGCTELYELNLSGWDTSNVTDMSGMFMLCTNLSELDLSSWNTSNVKDMSVMFCGSGLGELDLSSWNTSNVEDMSNMFNGCENLTSLDLSSWNTSNVTNMSGMFDGCSELETIYVGPDWSTASSSDDMFTGSYLSNEESAGGKYAHTGVGGYLTLKLKAKEAGTGEYWTTFYNNENDYQVLEGEGTQVFIVALNGTTLTLTEIEDGIINSGQAVVLKSEKESIVLPATEGKSESDYTGNSLQGTMSKIPNPNSGHVYVLNYKEGAGKGVGFYKLSSGGTIGAMKAYLMTTNEDAREFFSFDETTAIEAIDNGQLAIDDVVYDLQGRRISQPTKSLYIVNGKKVFINK